MVYTTIYPNEDEGRVPLGISQNGFDRLDAIIPILEKTYKKEIYMVYIDHPTSESKYSASRKFNLDNSTVFLIEDETQAKNIGLKLNGVYNLSVGIALHQKGKPGSITYFNAKEAAKEAKIQNKPFYLIKNTNIESIL